MNELTDRDESGLGWVYPPQPQQTFIEEVIGMVSGFTELVEAQDYIDVVFGSAQPTADWAMIEASIFNTTDGTPVNLWPGVVTSKTTTGFRLQLNGTPDSGNYFLSWSIRGVFGYYLSGPTSGRRNVASSPFTVRLPDESTLTGTVIITPTDGGVGGTFTPSTIALTIAAPSATFTYTPSSYGARSIGTDNDRGLIDPAEIGFTAIAAEYTLDGPTDGVVGQESTNFTVALPVGGAVLGSVTVTPDDGGAGGTFTPTTVELTTAAPSATFTYTPASEGAKTISTTNDAGLTDPGSLTYTVTPVFVDNFTGTSLLTSHTADTGETWTKITGIAGTYVFVGSGSVYGGVGGEETFASFTPASADSSATITVSKGAISGASFVGIWMRVTDHPTNPRGYMGRYVEGTGYQFYRLDAGITYVQLGSDTAGSLADGDELRFSVSGTGANVVLTMYKNGTSVATVTDSDANRITSNGTIGITIYDTTSGTGNYRINKMIA